MFKRSIFIASAVESIRVAAAIAQELSVSGYQPVRWWKEFTPGSITVERLLQIAGDVDGAVFVCAGTDRVWYRSGATCIPRDNVILEYGMFITRIGLKRALLLRDERTKFPSDLQSVAYEHLVDDLPTVSEKVVDHFNCVFLEPVLPTPIESLSLISDPEVASKQVSKELPSDWLMRSFYIGREGAQAWLAIRSDPVYQSKEVNADLRRDILEMIRDLDVRAFVSLGPGDGILDRDIAISLRNRRDTLQYVPVDISYGLLQTAYQLVAQEVEVPFGILGDFEDRFNFISRKIHSRLKSPILYGLIGNIFGNLDRPSEKAFLFGLKKHMSESDSLLLELAVIKENRTEHSPHLAIGSLSDGFKHFLASGMARRFGLDANTVFDAIENHLQASCSGDNSDVPGTQTTQYCTSRGQQLVANVRRYDWGLLHAWLQDEIGFKVIDSRRIGSATVADRGLLLLGK